MSDQPPEITQTYSDTELDAFKELATTPKIKYNHNPETNTFTPTHADDCPCNQCTNQD